MIVHSHDCKCKGKPKMEGPCHCAKCGGYVATNKRVARFEVIDEKGRAYTRHDIGIELSYQDSGQTLKVFVSDRS